MAKKDHSTKFYCYAHRTADTGHIFYIGKGHGDRAYSKQRSRYWHNKANKHGYTIEIIATGLTEHQAFDMEREFIAFYGRDRLVNLTDGGEGQSGFKITENQKNALCRKGAKLSDETKEKLRKANIGKKQSIETINKRTKNQKGRKHNEETIKKMKIAQSNRSEDTRRKIGESRKGKPRPKHVIDAIVKKHSKPVICVETNQTFSSCKLAADWLNEIGYKSSQGRPISDCAKGKYSSAYNHTWKYA